MDFDQTWYTLSPEENLEPCQDRYWPKEKEQPTIYKTLHIKQKTEQREPEG
jgi:hypothetical protein